MEKRDSKTIMDLILDIANKSESVRAVILNGSRTSPSAIKDDFQDYDIIYIVDNVEPFVENRDWLGQFGELLIMQTPDEMDGIWPASKDSFAFLMLFQDGNRIDLRLMQYKKYINIPRDSQSILLLDKDKKLGEFDPPSDNDYLPKPPTEKEFNDCCNEFFWASTNVAKGVVRKQLTYAKYMSEQIMKDQLIKLLIWYAGMKTHFQTNIGFQGKYLEQYLEPEIWEKFKKTYVDADFKNIGDSIFLMLDIFNESGLKISHHYQYKYNLDQYRQLVEYLQTLI